LTPCAGNQDTDDNSSVKTHDIVVAPFKAETKKYTLSLNQVTSERTKLLQKKKNIYSKPKTFSVIK
jgi:hypothetical protein